MTEILLLNVVYLFFPYFIYIFYSIYNFNSHKKENSIILSFTILSSLYLVMRFVPNVNYRFAYLIANIPLFISYYKRLKLDSIVLSIILIIYYNSIFFVPIWVLLILYVTSYVSVFVLKRNKEREILNTFALLDIIYIVVRCQITTDNIFKLVLALIILYFLAYISLNLFRKSEEIIHINNALQTLEQEKQVKESLFKITHEIKNPIAVCKGYLDMYEPNSIKSQKYIPIIKSEINRLLLLLEDFMAIGTIKINQDVLDVNFLLEEVVNNYSSLLKEKNIFLNQDIKDEEIYVIGDYNRLMQVFINIIKNAIEVIELGGLLEIRTRILKNQIVVSIKDNGPGMSEEVLSKIKEPFYTTKRKGSGLGIPLSYNIVEAHKGSMEYISKEGLGTEVIIKLPLFDVK